MSNEFDEQQAQHIDQVFVEVMRNFGNEDINPAVLVAVFGTHFSHVISTYFRIFNDGTGREGLIKALDALKIEALASFDADDLKRH